jgi:hypothetical protein
MNTQCENSTDHPHSDFKYIQSPHWHLSQSDRQSTLYRGGNTLDPTRVVFPGDSSADFRLNALRDAGYRIVKYEK